ncbi:3-dehydroquinate synthase [Parasphaerochaeta coccoides]|uniref:3-dehydroquinate synthase n=1 Tax=Parasphaerochaeta coccoides (strain ATCC BAA-1237 / DSM 17374 / SPN1) TaxID=760011 RepID=F4GJB4_PARC1|nr:3-dehydroquinate synthase family protein [Parasphaerochaeta coccoides]AEC01754.1 3-dehydroquinate synthase [Parasphaerochaeta coccoides DSM 17374]
MEERISVVLASGRKSSVYIASNTSELSARLSSYGANVLWVMDEHTSQLLRPLPPIHVILEAGEPSKNWRNVEIILRTAVQEGLARDAAFVGIGGGVLCDMTAFAASLFMRGCSLVLVPTTLLCMTDAALGGKTAIDYMGGKNLVGTFYPARDILIFPELLKSLPEGEYVNGLAEMLKHALLTEDESLYRTFLTKKKNILDRDPVLLRTLIGLSLDVKAAYISRDPEEKNGIRQALNLGHTFGHALESLGGFRSWSHGAAVAWGIGRALEAGTMLGLTEPRFAAGAQKLLAMYGYDMDYRIGRGEWMQFRQNILRDKKKEDGHVHFILLEKQGIPIRRMVDEQMIQALVISPPLKK